MASSFRNYYEGTVICRLSSDTPERFLNLCRNKGIYLWDVQIEGDCYQCAMHLKDFRKIRPIAKKSHCKLRIIRRIGFPFFLSRNKKHKMFFGGILLSLILLYILSLFVWDIEITGNSYYTNKAIIEYLNTIDITVGIKKDKIDLADLEEELRLYYNNISWVSAQVVGTRLFIEIREGKVPDTEATQLADGDIIAEADAVISSMVIRTGTPAVALGDQVQAGDVLVYGHVDIYNDDGTLRVQNAVAPDADIMASVVYHCEEYYPAYYDEKIYTGKSSTQYQWIWANQATLTLPVWGGAFENADSISELSHYRLTPTFYLPVSLNKTVTREYTLVQKRYTDAQMTTLGEEKINRLLTSFLANGAIIKDNQAQIKIEENNFLIIGDIYMEQPIGTCVSRLNPLQAEEQAEK